MHLNTLELKVQSLTERACSSRPASPSSPSATHSRIWETIPCYPLHRFIVKENEAMLPSLWGDLGLEPKYSDSREDNKYSSFINIIFIYC